MPQNTNELQGPFTGQFSGLDESSSVDDIPASGAAVFHNCDVSADGAVVRRGGTAVIADINFAGQNSKAFISSIRTRNGSDYLITTTDSGVSVSLMRDVAAERLPRIIQTVTKGGIWTRPITSVCFVPTTSPFDRLLMLTPEHPIVQLSFLERSFTLVCVSNTALTGYFFTASSPNDSTLWNDTSAASYIATNDVTGAVHTISAKGVGFSFELNGTFVAGTSYTLTLRQITWQWWAESLYWEGADVVQAVSRFNVTDSDQSVKVPDRIISDIDPVFKNSAELGLRALSTSAVTGTIYTPLTNAPTTENAYGFSAGARYVPAAGNVLNISPFFATFGARQAAGGVGQVSFTRARELRFNGGAGITPNNLRVVVNGVPYGASLAISPGLVATYIPVVYTYSATERIFGIAASGTTVSNALYFFNDPLAMPFNASIMLTNTGSISLFVSAQDTHYRDIPISGGTLDGRYVRAFGIGAFVDYSKRNFHSNGIVYRGRLILQNPQAARDQLLCSGVEDTAVPGEFYQFFQVTDALQGIVDDPFTVNVTNDARERITALIGWQQTVFVFTNSNTYSVNSQGQFAAESYNVNLVSTYGAFNQNCVIVTNLTVLYMNRFGLFDLLNKPNTDSYGAVERSLRVRKLFNRDIVSAAFDNLHWLQYNEATNKVYIGLAIGNEQLWTSRHLVLNMSWDAWSTFSSAVPFRMSLGTQVFSYTLLIADIANTGQYYALLCTDMPFYMDFAYYTAFSGTFPFSIRTPVLLQSRSADSRGIVDTVSPVTPGLNDHTVPASTKVASSYVRNDGLASFTNVTPRNAMLDVAPTLALLGGNASASVIASVSADSAFAVYASATQLGGFGPLTMSLTDMKRFGANTTIATANSQQLVGVSYPSVYASPMFDLDALGRLKRLKRLHLLFDTTITRELFYIALPAIRIVNAAFVNVLFNYRDAVATTELSIVGELTATPLPEARGVIEHTLPLQGTGCSYQFYVTSVGVEAFKLAAYEFEVAPARDKRYVRP